MSAEVWSAVCPAPVEAKKIAVRQMMDLKAEAEAATGKRASGPIHPTTLMEYGV